ncbi:ABC transporter ATP-binding protein [Pontibacter qinzhouensis]|uniref:ABC transporter ATP-binding protein n=1 Tax=Pontibacter qinzhouensis TaxID=2603253 RepID=A0A5C8K7M3_9BACT|nr:ABC transporter ATP-binding protein [Pontibacter qinzhouensis]TXK48749.1 ABC transporter ATP-binding protein [Pontibacter qinzhouensis]
MSFLNVAGVSLLENENAALQDVSFSQEEFQKIAIAGETGSGKSTLLQIIAGLTEPSAGEVFFESRKVIGPVEKLVPGHPHIFYLSQQFELPQFLRVEQILKYANKLSSEEAAELYDLCRISHLAKRQTNQLSGGERQRIALARLLIKRPKLLLLDEPFSNLDGAHKKILKSIIHDIGEKLDITCILISHDPHDTLSWADQILVLQAGQIIQRGTPEQIYKQPVNEYTAALFGNYNLLQGAAAKAVATATGISLNGKNLLIRPENILLSADAAEGVAATVQQVNYFGSHYEVQLQVAGTVVTSKTTDPHHQPGSEVFVSFSPADVSYV